MPRSPEGESTGKVALIGPRAVVNDSGGSSPSGEDYYRGLVERSNDIILTMNVDGILTSANLGASRVLGYTPDELVGMNVVELIAPGDRERSGIFIGALLASGEDGAHIQLEHVAKDGHRVFVDVAARAIRGDGRIVGLEGIGRDITELHSLQEALAYQAFHDPLTGLANRKLFFDRLAQALARAERCPSRVAVLLLDLDNFKLVNDSLGHDVGDELLIAVAQALGRALRASESAARLGGDEFAFVIEDVNSETQLLAVASRVLSAVTEQLALNDHIAHVTASLGIALAEPGADPVLLLRNADIAMYQAKAERRGGFAFFDPKAHNPHAARA